MASSESLFQLTCLSFHVFVCKSQFFALSINVTIRITLGSTPDPRVNPQCSSGRAGARFTMGKLPSGSKCQQSGIFLVNIMIDLLEVDFCPIGVQIFNSILPILKTTRISESDFFIYIAIFLHNYVQ